MPNGNGEAAEPKTLDAIAAMTWNDTMGEDTDELPLGTEHLGDSVEDAEVIDENANVDDTQEASSEDTGAEEEQSASDEDQGEEEQGSDDSARVAPEHWSNEDRQMFDKLDDTAKDFLLRRHRQMEGDYTRKTQEHAEAVKVGRLIEEGLDPAIKAELRRIGVDNESYIRQMMAWHHMSVSDPVRFVQGVVQQLGLDPAQVFGKPQEGEPDQQEGQSTSAEAQRLAAIERHLNSEQQARHNQLIQQTHQRVETFKDEKDDAGNLKHPHFDAVRKDMAVFLRVDPSMTLEAAYDAAVFKNPELRASISSAPTPAAGGNSHTARTTKALKAVRANIRGGASSVDQAEPKSNPSLQQAMKAAADEIGM